MIYHTSNTLYEMEFNLPTIDKNCKYNRDLVFDPNVFVSSKRPDIRLNIDNMVTEPKLHNYWATCRHGITRPVNYMTHRTIRDLPTQVRFEVSTQNRQNPMSPIWAEFFMGYETNWTQF